MNQKKPAGGRGELASSVVSGRFREPAQRRSRESLARVYRATNELLDRSTFDQITIAQISDRAQVSVGSIYQRFGSKDDLLWALYDAYLSEAAEVVASMDGKSNGKALSSRIEALVLMICGLFRSHRGIVRSLLLKYRQTPGEIPASYLSRVETVYEVMRRDIRRALSSPSKSEVEFSFSLMMAACRERILFADFRGVDPERTGDVKFARRLSQTLACLIESRSV